MPAINRHLPRQGKSQRRKKMNSKTQRSNNYGPQRPSLRIGTASMSMRTSGSQVPAGQVVELDNTIRDIHCNNDGFPENERGRGRVRPPSLIEVQPMHGLWMPLDGGSLCLRDDSVHITLYRWMKDFLGFNGDILTDCFFHARIEPPITKQSLSELDIGAIISNPKLRHDVNFDRELHFRPNLDGAKGRKKVKDAEDYWTALTTELELYGALFSGRKSELRSHFGGSWPKIISASKRRIPTMFETIRDVLKDLVPERDKAMVDDQLDVPMLMQKIEKGVCDFVSLSQWLAHLLKAHCAPMRDEWVDKMVEQTKIGVEDFSSRSIVDGLQMLLGILEAMKLDVANHQIRHLRALLIEDTIGFEQKYHLQRISRHRLNVDRAAEWYLREEQHARQIMPPYLCGNTDKAKLNVFVAGLVRLLVPKNPHDNDPRELFPESFYLDTDRLRSLKGELHDMVHLDICLDVFAELLKQVGYQHPITDATRQILRNSLLVIASEHGHGTCRKWLPNIENIAVELVRQVLHLCHPPYSYCAGLVQFAECWLREMLYAPYPDTFSIRCAALETALVPQVLECVEKHMNSSPVDIFNALIACNIPPPPPPLLSAAAPAIPKIAEELPLPRNHHLADIVRRMTQIAVLHWRIWSPIVYARPYCDKFAESFPEVVTQTSTLTIQSPILPQAPSPPTTGGYRPPSDSGRSPSAPPPSTSLVEGGRNQSPSPEAETEAEARQRKCTAAPEPLEQA